MWISQLYTRVKVLKSCRLDRFIHRVKIRENDIINIQKYGRKYGKVKFDKCRFV